MMATMSSAMVSITMTLLMLVLSLMQKPMLMVDVVVAARAGDDAVGDAIG